MQELIELEATDVIGAKPYERTDSRVNERNGHRPRMLSTQAGDIELKIPKLSHGSFFPALLEPRRRIDQALHAVIMQAYVEGVSTRSVDDLVQALGIDSGISKSQVSRICGRLDVQVDAFRNRSLGHVEFPYVYLDATYVKARDTGMPRPGRSGTRRMGECGPCRSSTVVLARPVYTGWPPWWFPVREVTLTRRWRAPWRRGLIGR
jgi:putative transposase